MKNLFKTILALFVVFSYNSCSEGDTAADDVLDNFTNGAALRTIEVLSSILNSSDDNSFFSVSVEEQDAQGGDLLQQVDIRVRIQDLTPENGTTTSDNALIKSVMASEFTDGPFGLPRATLTATYGEAVAAMGLAAADVFPGDLFIFEFQVLLTDGRLFGVVSAGSSITGGFFDSPYAYNSLVSCTPEPGDYRVEMHDSFGDGWQTNGGSGGDGIQVDIDGTIVVVGMCSPYGGGAGSEMDPALGVCTPWAAGTDPANDLSYTDATAFVNIPVGSSSATWNFPGDEYGEISLEIYAPDDSLLYEGAQGATGPGLLPVTFCLQAD